MLQYIGTVFLYRTDQTTALAPVKWGSEESPDIDLEKQVAGSG